LQSLHFHDLPNNVFNVQHVRTERMVYKSNEQAKTMMAKRHWLGAVSSGNAQLGLRQRQ